MSPPDTAWQRFHGWLEAPRPSRRLLWHAYKFAWGLAMVGIVSIFYLNAAHLTAQRSTDLSLALDRAIPFVPWSWWFYFPGYLACLAVAIFAMQDTRHFYRSLAAIFLAQTICTAAFLVLPSTYPRPTEAGGGLTGDAIRWFWTVDPPNDTFPSMHVAISLLAALALWRNARARLPLKLLCSALALGVVITVHTAKQHYLVDTVGGMGVAAVSWLLVSCWWARLAPARPDAPRTASR